METNSQIAPSIVPPPTSEARKYTRDEIRQIVEAAREELRLANPAGRNLLGELIAERRAAAAAGE